MAPKVSIVITSYLEKSKPYLDLCIRSIKALSFPKEDLEVIIVSPKWYQPHYEGVLTIHPDADDYGNSHAINVGVKASRHEYLIVANDDVVFTRDSVTNLINALKGNPNGLLMPISNDWQKKYFLLTAVRTGDHWTELHGPCRYDETKGIHDAMIDASSPYPFGVVFFPWLCLYVAAFHRKMLEDVGLFEERLKTGQDDVDYCKRAWAKGYYCGIVLNSLIWHFGGVTSSITLTDEVRVANHKAFIEKWGEPPP